jgi:DNA polymerase III alpha subunit
MAYDAKSKHVVVGVEMSNAEAMGAVKFDFLGVVALDKLRFSQDMINCVSKKAEVIEDYKENE